MSEVNQHITFSTVTLILIFSTSFISSSNAASAAYNVINYGAKTDGRTDATPAFLKAWTAACTSYKPANVIVPSGKYLIKPVTFSGPCKRKITIHIYGTIVAPSDYRDLGNSGHWILFISVNSLSVYGGTFDANAAGFWACRNSGKSCPVGARSITFNWADNVVISGLTSLNSQMSHVVINSCNNVKVVNLKVNAPADSPNTDGIHIQGSTGVTITGSKMQTGDDCVSIGPGSKNIFMSNIQCGPGHGISIGSLGNSLVEDGVQNVTVRNSVFTGTQNGVRIKTWARKSNSFVKNVVYENLIMKNAQNPIVIDQNYCPDNTGCPNQSSGVKIRQVSYRNIKGTSATLVAMEFDCSSRKPCTGIKLQDINLTYMNEATTSSCKNSGGTNSGNVVMPESCL